MLDPMQRSRKLLEIAKDITIRGKMIMEAFYDPNVRIDWFDNTASELCTLVYADLGIPSRFVDDETGTLMVEAMDGRVELDVLMDRLRGLQVEVQGGDISGGTD